jgi:predicted component of type VI protein secretion system
LFGRNAARCDVCFVDDPLKRLSNIHFRIYVNQFGVVMIEDQSTNGTIVDGTLLKGKTNEVKHTRRVLSSGSRINILMHKENMDLEFLVRIPRRDGHYDDAYRDKLDAFFKRLNAIEQEQENTRTIVPGLTGPPNVFAAAANAPPRRPLPNGNPQGQTTQEAAREMKRDRLPLEWNGSGKYNRVAMIGKGAFAVVYQVTHKFDGLPYAAKELDKRQFMKNGVLDQKVDNEMKIMQKINHVRFYSSPSETSWLTDHHRHSLILLNISKTLNGTTAS